MTHFRQVADDFWVSPQIGPEEVEAAAREGFRTIINNRPDGEEAHQPPSADLQAIAAAAGLAWIEVPTSSIGQAQVEAMDRALAEAEGPVLAFCRSGTRSITLWALAETLGGRRTRAEAVEPGAKAGYDLSRLPG